MITISYKTIYHSNQAKIYVKAIIIGINPYLSLFKDNT